MSTKANRHWAHGCPIPGATTGNSVLFIFQHSFPHPHWERWSSEWKGGEDRRSTGNGAELSKLALFTIGQAMRSRDQIGIQEGKPLAH